MNINEIIKKLNAISFFQGEVTFKRLDGGLSNYSYLVIHNNKKYVARFLTNREHYHVLNFHELAANKAASEAGVAPKVLYNNKVFLNLIRYRESLGLPFDCSIFKQFENSNNKKIFPIVWSSRFPVAPSITTS